MVFEYDLEEDDSRRLDEDDDNVGRVSVGDNGRRPRKYATLQLAIPKSVEEGITFTSGDEVLVGVEDDGLRVEPVEDG